MRVTDKTIIATIKKLGPLYQSEIENLFHYSSYSLAKRLVNITNNSDISYIRIHKKKTRKLFFHTLDDLKKWIQNNPSILSRENKKILRIYGISTNKKKSTAVTISPLLHKKVKQLAIKNNTTIKKIIEDKIREIKK